VRHDQCRPAGRKRDRLGQVGRRLRHGVRLGLAQYQEIGVAPLHGELVLRIAARQPPLRRQLAALDRLIEGGYGALLIGFGGGFKRAVEVSRRHRAVEERRDVERRLDMDADQMGAVALGQLDRNVQAMRELGAGIAVNENGLVAHGPLPVPAAGVACSTPAAIAMAYAGLTSTCLTLGDGVAVLAISTVSTPLAKRAAMALVSASAGRVKARVKLP